MDYLVGVDVGTQGTKTVIYDRDGRAIAEAFQKSNLVYGSGGRVEEDPQELLASCLKTIKQNIERADINNTDIAAVALDGQMAGIMGIDTAGNSVTPYDSWLDQRCAKYFDMIRRAGEERYMQIGGGSPVTYAHGPKILWWKHEKPEAYAKIAKFVPPAVYCVMQMCGLNAERAYIDHTYLHFAGFASVEKKEWSGELLDTFGLDPEKFPRIVKPWNIAGRVTKQMAEASGLAEGTPVAAGCGDTAASAFGAGVTHPGVLYDVGGTASTLAGAVDRFIPDIGKKMLIYPAAVVDGLYTPMAYMNGAGMCINWFKDNVLSGGYQYSYDELNCAIEKIEPGSENLLFIPHYAGRVCPNSQNLRGAWLRLNWNHTKAHMYRSIMESIGYEYKIYLNRIRELIPEQEYGRILAVGGAAKSPQFRKIKADILGLTEATISRTDTATLAEAVIGGYAVGLFNDLSVTIHSINKECGVTEPDMENHRKYRPFINAYERSLELMDGCFSEINQILE